MSRMARTKKKQPKAAKPISGMRQMAAGEFKAKCLAIMDEINKTGRPMVVTKRGVPVAKVVPIGKANAKGKKDPIFGRMKGIVEIVGDPDDLLLPVFPLEDYDMLK